MGSFADSKWIMLSISSELARLIYRLFQEKNPDRSRDLIVMHYLKNYLIGSQERSIPWSANFTWRNPENRIYEIIIRIYF